MGRRSGLGVDYRADSCLPPAIALRHINQRDYRFPGRGIGGGEEGYRHRLFGQVIRSFRPIFAIFLAGVNSDVGFCRTTGVAPDVRKRECIPQCGGRKLQAFNFARYHTGMVPGRCLDATHPVIDARSSGY